MTALPSAGVVDALALEHAQQRRPVLVGRRAVRAVERLGGGVAGFLAHDHHVLHAARHRVDLDLAGAVEVVHEFHRLAHRFAQREQAVVAQDHRLGGLADPRLTP